MKNQAKEFTVELAKEFGGTVKIDPFYIYDMEQIEPKVVHVRMMDEKTHNILGTVDSINADIAEQIGG